MNVSYLWKTENPGEGLGVGLHSPSTKSSHCFDEPFSPNTFW